MKVDTNIDVKERKRVVLNEFRGVDTASPLYNIDKKRASYMVNFISRNGANHKRYGWEQTHQKFNGKINGVFDFTLQGVNVKIVYAGTTFYVFDDSQNKYVSMQSKLSSNYKINDNNLKDYEVKLYIYNNKAYFIGCGDYLILYIKNNNIVFDRVYNNEHTYIPTTTENISCIEQDKDENDKIIVYGARQTQRDVNLLNSKRINTIIGSQQYYAQGATFVPRTYKLDATNINDTNFSVNIIAGNNEYNLIAQTSGQTEYKYYLNRTQTLNTMSNGDLYETTNPATRASRFDVQTLDIFKTNTVTLGTYKYYARLYVRNTQDTYYPTKLYIYLDYYNDDTNVLHTVNVAELTKRTDSVLYNWTVDYENDYRYEHTTGDYWGHINLSTILGANAPYSQLKIEDYETSSATSTNSKWQYLVNIGNKLVNVLDYTDEWGNVNYATGILALSKAHSSSSGEANITVTFETYQDPTKLINCTTSTLFGLDGTTNTLFISGNSSLPNYDWWSNPADLSYFPSGNECAVGTSNSAIVGYQRLGDDTLAIVKSPNYYEPTLYIRSGEETSLNDDNTVKVGYFYTNGKYVSNKGGVSKRSFAMLNGDPLFLSQEGVCSISLSESNITNPERVAKEKSRLINKLLKAHTEAELKDSLGYVYDGKYYLSVGTTCYVADARYVFSEKGDMSDTYNYEWWVWDNMPIKYFYTNSNNELCFGTSDGRLCKISNIFNDVKFETIQNANILLDSSTNKYNLSTNSQYLSDGGIIKISNATSIPYYETSGTPSSKSNNKVYINGKEEDIYDGMKVFIGQNKNVERYIYDTYIQESGGSYTTSFSYKDANGNIDNLSSYAELSYLRPVNYLTNDYYKVDELSSGVYNIVNYTNTDKVYNLALSSNINNVLVYSFDIKPVVSKWYTPVLDCGLNDYIKTLLGITIATDQITNGTLKFGYETKSAYDLIDANIKNYNSRGLDVFDFDTLRFDRLAFDTGFNTSFSMKIKKDFNFIIFRFVSDNGYDCCINSLTITYKINRRNKGVF